MAKFICYFPFELRNLMGIFVVVDKVQSKLYVDFTVSVVMLLENYNFICSAKADHVW